MFIHNFKYTLKTLFKNKSLLFWTFAFPIILGTFFNMAFSNFSNSTKLDIIDVAIVDNEEFEFNLLYKNAFEELSDKENEDRLFNTKYVSEKKAKQMLNDNKIDGYIKIEENKPQLVFNQNGINQTIIKYVTDEITGTRNIIENLSNEEIKKYTASGNYNIDYNEIYTKVLKIAQEKQTNIKDESKKDFDFMVIEFYTLIAMAALYGGIISMTVINNSLPNMGNIGKRVSVSPTKKSTVLLSSLLASYITQIFGLVLLFIYTKFVLKVNYGDNFLLVILLALAGTLAGLALGIFVGTVFKLKESGKIGILLGFTMLGSFFSGMMGVSLKYVIDKNVPIINKLNPAAMITDGYYALYYYDTYNRYFFNVFSLLIFALVLILISFVSLRRQKYDSI